MIRSWMFFLISLGCFGGPNINIPPGVGDDCVTTEDCVVGLECAPVGVQEAMACAQPCASLDDCPRSEFCGCLDEYCEWDCK